MSINRLEVHALLVDRKEFSTTSALSDSLPIIDHSYAQDRSKAAGTRSGACQVGWRVPDPGAHARQQLTCATTRTPPRATWTRTDGRCRRSIPPPLRRCEVVIAEAWNNARKLQTRPATWSPSSFACCGPSEPRTSMASPSALSLGVSSPRLEICMNVNPRVAASAASDSLERVLGGKL